MKKNIGDVILDVKNISLRFGGVKALTDISFNVREHEIRAIIGPNGAGKSSMLNCINGVYIPSEGTITFRGQTFDHMDSHQVAEMGIARTFQNLALFKGMSVLDNIMTGRNLRMKSNLFLQALRIGPARIAVCAAVEFGVADDAVLEEDRWRIGAFLRPTLDPIGDGDCRIGMNRTRQLQRTCHGRDIDCLAVYRVGEPHRRITPGSLA